jgi:hypothetical protein
VGESHTVAPLAPNRGSLDRLHSRIIVTARRDLEGLGGLPFINDGGPTAVALP